MRFVLMVLCCTLQLAVVINAACVCNEPGVDHCAACNEHSVVRPKPKPFVPPLVLPPVGDNCWCNKLRVQPAALPKTCDRLRTPSSPNCNCRSKPNYSYGNALPKAPIAYDTPIYNNPPLNYYAPPSYNSPQTYDSPPADPVSISLAVQAGKAIGVPEAKLAFGFVQKPLDGLPKIQFSDVPEENLFKLKNEVITLKKLPLTKAKVEDEPIIEEEEEENSPYDEGVDLKLSYKQLGYETEQFINPKFRRVLPAYAYAANPAYAAKPIYARTKVDCGFIPGRIAPALPATKSDCYKEY